MEQHKTHKITLRGLWRFTMTHFISLFLSTSAFFATSFLLEHAIPPKEIWHYPLIYGIILLIPLIGIQLGLQLYALFTLDECPVLLFYYFQYSDDEIPHTILDPTKSNIGLIVLILLLIGGYMAWPIYSIYGLILSYDIYFTENPLTTEYITYLVKSLALTISPLLCLLYTSPSPRDLSTSRMPSSA